eukprot:TRINITY_DN46426_c0_g1_i1.p3 TRINITY_DN46426_c0_g1~~TRINITY_DN46426_c0_g1_i1.p3  ORF type:complete len:101 (+),score=43.33 TRINITY_DN46426_c0_g1_i1:45-347(+)
MLCLRVFWCFFFFSSRRRHTRCREVSWARRCVQETGTWVFEKLKEKYTKGSLSLYDFDGYDEEAKGLTLSEVLLNSKRKMGHAFVLKMMLLEKYPWKEET